MKKKNSIKYSSKENNPCNWTLISAPQFTEYKKPNKAKIQTFRPNLVSDYRD